LLQIFFSTKQLEYFAMALPGRRCGRKCCKLVRFSLVYFRRWVVGSSLVAGRRYRSYLSIQGKEQQHAGELPTNVGATMLD